MKINRFVMILLFVLAAVLLTSCTGAGVTNSWSGVTANPLVGQVVDDVIDQGGTAVLAETPEIYGAEQLLLSRVKSESAARKLIHQVRWWEAQAKLLGFSLEAPFNFHIHPFPYPDSRREHPNIGHSGLDTVLRLSLVENRDHFRSRTTSVPILSFFVDMDRDLQA